MRAAIQKEGLPNVRKGCTTLKQKVTQRAPILCFYRMSVSGTERQAYSGKGGPPMWDTPRLGLMESRFIPRKFSSPALPFRTFFARSSCDKSLSVFHNQDSLKIMGNKIVNVSGEVVISILGQAPPYNVPKNQRAILSQ
jgi:hypothetical protein